MSSDISIPMRLLQDFVGAKIKVDTGNHEFFLGTLVECQDNMNMTLGDVTAHLSSGHVQKMEDVFIKGHRIRYASLPSGAKETVRQLHRELKPQGGFRRGRGGGRPFRGGGRPFRGGRR